MSPSPMSIKENFMKLFKRFNSTVCTALSIFLLAIAPCAYADPVYKSADFSGGLFSVVNLYKTRLTAAGYDSSLFDCYNCANPTTVDGHVIFDSSLPIAPSGVVNVASIGAIANVANTSIFEMNIGGISLHFGDAGILGGPAIQYSNGVFNGFFFVDDFLSPNGTGLELNVQGGVFNLYRTSDNKDLLTGFINVGANGLTNIQSFTPAVPEPETYAMMLLGLSLVGAIARRKKQA